MSLISVLMTQQPWFWMICSVNQVWVTLYQVSLFLFLFFFIQNLVKKNLKNKLRAEEESSPRPLHVGPAAKPHTESKKGGESGASHLFSPQDCVLDDSGDALP